MNDAISEADSDSLTSLLPINKWTERPPWWIWNQRTWQPVQNAWEAKAPQAGIEMPPLGQSKRLLSPPAPAARHSSHVRADVRRSPNEAIFVPAVHIRPRRGAGTRPRHAGCEVFEALSLGSLAGGEKKGHSGCARAPTRTFFFIFWFLNEGIRSWKMLPDAPRCSAPVVCWQSDDLSNELTISAAPFCALLRLSFYFYFSFFLFLWQA